MHKGDFVGFACTNDRNNVLPFATSSSEEMHCERNQRNVWIHVNTEKAPVCSVATGFK